MTPEQLTEARKIAAISAPGSGVALLVAHIDAQDRVLRTVERWANHHASKPKTTAQEALSVIQHHPAIREITASYADGVVPDTPDPYAEIERLRDELALCCQLKRGDPVRPYRCGPDSCSVSDCAGKA